MKSNNHTKQLRMAKKGKYIIIFYVWTKQLIQPQVGNRQISNILFEISYIDKQGEIELLQRAICGKEFESMIHVTLSFFRIFIRVSLEDIIYEYQCTIE